MKLNFWKKKKKELTIEEKADAIISQVKELAKEKEFSIAYFSCLDTEGGSTYVNGNPGDIFNCIKSAYESNPGFKRIIDFVSSGQDLNDLFSNKRNSTSKKFMNLPDGMKGFMIDGKDISSMTDKDIDDIINDITKDHD